MWIPLNSQSHFRVLFHQYSPHHICHFWWIKFLTFFLSCVDLLLSFNVNKFLLIERHEILFHRFAHYISNNYHWFANRIFVYTSSNWTGSTVILQIQVEDQWWYIIYKKAQNDFIILCHYDRSHTLDDLTFCQLYNNSFKKNDRTIPHRKKTQSKKRFRFNCTPRINHNS